MVNKDNRGYKLLSFIFFFFLASLIPAYLVTLHHGPLSMPSSLLWIFCSFPVLLVQPFCFTSSLFEFSSEIPFVFYLKFSPTPPPQHKKWLLSCILKELWAYSVVPVHSPQPERKLLKHRNAEFIKWQSSFYYGLKVISEQTLWESLTFKEFASWSKDNSNKQ